MFKPANQASKEISEAKNEKANADRILVSDAIENMIKCEKTSFYLYKAVMPSVKKELEEAGYAIAESTHRNEYLMTVSIKEIK